MSSRLDALFYPFTICLDPTSLKYLLLLYDRILYLPIDNILNPGHTSLSKRWSVHDSMLCTGFSDSHHTARALMYGSHPSAWDDEMKALMDAYDRLEAEGICVGLRDKRFEASNQLHPLSTAVDEDLKDSHFVYQARRSVNTTLAVPHQPKTGTMKGGGVAFRSPRHSGELMFLELTSERLNSALFFGEAEHVVPVGTHPAFVAMLNAKIRRVVDSAVPAIPEAFPQKNRARYNMLSWHVLSESAPAQTIARRTVDEILKYRRESEAAADRFHSFLRALETDLKEEPWSDRSRAEITAVVQNRVLPELQRVRDAKADIWRKLFGEAVTTVLSTKNVVGASSAVLALHVVPGLSYVDLLGGGGVLLAQLLPKLFEARDEEVQVRRNSLFFMFNLR